VVLGSPATATKAARRESATATAVDNDGARRIIRDLSTAGYLQGSDLDGENGSR
jgi:hypothetical protein